MTQNLLTLYNVTASLVDGNHRQVAHVHVALNAPTTRALAQDALVDIRNGRSQLRAVIDLYALRATLTRLFEFNSALYSGKLRWIDGVDSWHLFFTLPAGTLPVGADECQRLVDQLLPDLITASFPGQGLQIVFDPNGHYLPVIAFR